jgi:hypothetical protein
MNLTKRSVILSVTGVVVAVALLMGASPASAGETCAGNSTNAPDGTIKINGQTVGAGQYPQTFQSFDADVGQSLTYRLRWRNMSDTTRTIRVLLQDVQRDPGYRVRYFVGDTDVSAKVKVGIALGFRDIGAGGRTPALKAIITNKSGANGSAIALLLSGRYKGAPLAACDALGPQMNED